MKRVIGLIFVCGFLYGCGAEALYYGTHALGALEYGAAAVGIASDISKSENTNTVAFAPEVDTEQTVRAVLDKGGEPQSVTVLNDNIPVSKILFYKRGDLIHPILFTHDEAKGVFVYQAVKGWKKEEFDKKKDTPEYKKACEEWYANELARRAFQYEKAGKVDLQYKYIQQIEKVSPISAFAYNSVAWFYAACPNPEYRNGQKAVTFGEKSVSMERNCYNLDSLAAAYAEVGDFDKAVQLQNEAISLCTDQKRKAEYSEVLGGYQNHKRRYQLAQ